MAEKYMPEIAICKIKTAGKTEKELREELTGQGFTYRDFQNIVKANNYFDGLTLWLSRWAYDRHENWHLWNWKEEDDEKVMLALYHAEQFRPMAGARPYKNDFDKFRQDWQNDTYDPGCSYTFTPEQVEVLEVVQQEVDTTDTEKTRREVRKAKEQKYRRYKATKRSMLNRRKKKR